MNPLSAIFFICVIEISSELCDSVTKAHWNLFSNAFLNTNYIRATTITTKGSHLNGYFDQFLGEAYENFKKSVFVQRLSVDHEDSSFDFLELFAWDGRKLPLRNTQLDSKMVVHDFDRMRSLNKDESSFGVLAVVDTIDMLDKYIYGFARRPFQATRGRFVVVILQAYSQHFETLVSGILKRMWADYGLLRVIIISPCQDNYFYQYNPFIPINKTKEINDDIDLWGEIKISQLNDSNALEKWKHSYPFTYNGYPMVAVVFPRLPTAMLWKELPAHFVNSYFCDAKLYSKEFGGVDGIIFGTLVHALNLTPSVFQPNNEYGYQLDNRSYIGSIGDVLYSKASLSINGRFIQDYGTNEIEFIYPIFFDKFCVIAPKALQIPQWLAVFRCFDPYVWTLILVSNTCFGIIWHLFKQWSNYLHKNRLIIRKANEIVSPAHNKVIVSIINMWLVMISGMPSILPYRSAERLFMTGCLLLSLTIGGTFQGSLTTSFSTKSYYKDVNTLRNLDESGLQIGSSSKNLENIFDNEGNPLFESIQKKFKIRKEPAIDRAAFQRDICCIERASDIKVIITMNYELADGSALLHVVKECPRSYHLAFIVRKGWPFLNRFNEMVMRLSEAGLLFKWYQQTEAAIILSSRLKRLKDINSSLEAFDMKDMQTGFLILILGEIICTCIFFIELFLEKRKKIISKKKLEALKENRPIKPKKYFY